MADLIALHWAPDEVTAVAPAKGRDVRAASLGAPPDGDPAAVGRWLKSELAKHKLSAKRATLVLPRSAAVFRKLTLPDVPDDELPDLVRMQAATKIPTPLDRLRLDFVPLPKRGETREALLATVPGKVADDLLAAVRAAGLEPAGLGLSPFGTAARVAAEGGPTLLVAVQGAAVEITLVRDSAVLLSHATELQFGSPDEDRQWLPGEVTRAVVAADHLAAAAGVSRVVLLGPGDFLGPLVKPFADRYGGRVDLIDGPQPLDAPSADTNVAPAALAAAAGQLQADGPPRLDFLSPRKRIEKPNRRRLQIAVAAAGLAAVALVAYGLSWSAQAALEDRQANLLKASGDLDAAVKRGQPTVAAFKAVDGWAANRGDWVGQLSTLDSALPGTERAYLTRLKLESSVRSTAGQISGAGFARNRYDVQGLNEALAEKGYLIKAKPVLESRRDAQYPASFELDLTVPKPKPPADADAKSSGGSPRPA